MDALTLVLAILLAFIVGALVGAFVMRARTPSTHEPDQRSELAAATAERDVLRERVVDLEATISEDGQTAALLRPLADALVRVEKQVNVLERDRLKQFGDVGATLKSVASSTDALRQQTASLAGSLKSSGVRGTWGEAQLRRVLESAGMLRHSDFSEQFRGTADTGADVRPDVVVHLPGERSLVIDAKAPMAAYLAAHSCPGPHPETPEDTDSAANALGSNPQPQVSTAPPNDAELRKHAAALRSHMDALSAKRYWTALPQAPEFVICFVPADAVLARALQTDPTLLEHGFDRNVVLASPSTLLATLRTAAHLWQAAALEENARELLSLGRELYDRIGVLGRHAHDLGASLRRSVESYNLFVGSLESRVMVTARKFHEHGISASAPPSVTPLTSSIRPMTAPELLEGARRADGDHGVQEGS